MDLKKYKLFTSGISEEQQEQIEAVESEFAKEQSKVLQTMRSPGFKLIMSKIVKDMEFSKIKTTTCTEKELKSHQLEIKIRKEFLDKWTPYAM